LKKLAEREISNPNRNRKNNWQPIKINFDISVCIYLKANRLKKLLEEKSKILMS